MFRFISLALATALLAGGGKQAAAADCYTPRWQHITDATVGASFDAPSTAKRSYYISDGTGYPSMTVEAESGDGIPVNGRCSTFSATVTDLGQGTIRNTSGFFAAERSAAVDGLSGGRILSSRTFTFHGHPAHEYRYTFRNRSSNTSASHRVLQVIRGSRLLTFVSIWSDAGGPPADPDRTFASIRLVDGVADPNLLTFARLQEAITKYWMYPSPGYTYANVLDRAALARLGGTRAADARTVSAFGYPRAFSVVRRDGPAKVVRVRHDNATVEWTVTESASGISAVRWRKL